MHGLATQKFLYKGYLATTAGLRAAAVVWLFILLSELTSWLITSSSSEAAVRALTSLASKTVWISLGVQAFMCIMIYLLAGRLARWAWGNPWMGGAIAAERSGGF